MAAPQILVAEDAGMVGIRVLGRVTFQLSQCLREFGVGALRRGVKNIIFDLSECSGMDSTILGILAMIGLEGRGKASMYLVNVPDEVKALIKSIGVARLFKIAEKSVPEFNWSSLCQIVESSDGAAIGDTVLEAHKTLIQIDPEHNAPKFKDLVELLDAEIRKRDT